MDIEFSDDTESILTQTINEFGTDEFIELSENTNVADASIRVLTEGTAIVKNEEAFPLGVLRREMAARLVQKEGPMSEYLRWLAPVAISPPETKIKVIMSVVQRLGFVPWFILRNEQAYAALVKPTSIIKIFAQYFEGRPAHARNYWTNVRTSLIDAPTDDDQSICYCCPEQFNNHKPHRVEEEDVEVDDNGDSVCPNHPSRLVVPSLDCSDC